jgi:methionyl-tRNA formyltransferase
MTRVVLCTSGGLYGALVLARLLQDDAVRVAGIVRSIRVLHPGYGWLRGAVEQLRRSGLAYTAYLGCATTLPDLLGRFCAVPSVTVRARRERIPLCATRDINSEAARRFIVGLEPDLLLSAFFNQRIGEAVTAIPYAGAVNIHPSLLPAFRGVDPVFFARLRGAATLGVSLHRVTADFDTGPLLAQEAVAIDDAASVIEATARLFVRGTACLVDRLPAILAGDDGTAQAAGGSYDSWPTPRQVRGFLERGNRLMRIADLGLLGHRGRALIAAGAASAER